MTKHGKATGEDPADEVATIENSPTPTAWASVNPNGYVMFQPPDSSPRSNELAAQIIELDHAAHERLGVNTPRWSEVNAHLINAANSLTYGDLDMAAVSIGLARKSYYLEAQNRIRYLVGVALGVASIAAVMTPFFVWPGILEPFVSPGLLGLIVVFAGMGTVTSVLTRLKSIDVTHETSSFLVSLSGASRPIVSVFTALVVYLILRENIVQVRFGTPPAGTQDGLYLVTSFLSGFSERFAQDLISRVPLAGGGSKG
jgi:hypothetical protein